ncbi:MAG TPA: 50S ribosomal protein L23 [Spirochaetota bacterium]|nr:50S ribosomal protein L23 [Spirochaetota bacterium]HPY02444.1 50S ribosomal protein L23 [Spirochaetota bacterium]HQA51512.1 50S ribosomal protein L23 [Spirochaetota bacterium]HQO21813.1 50S ribosomal protein L23 [Spirochaetota bacterium]HQQ22451.1 50S ribosomal protein L23 [Spirochaetota bacterium]
MNLNDVILKPVITEKSTLLNSDRKYVFKVAMDSNKSLVKQAVKLVFGVTPEDVNVINVRTRKKRTKFGIGRKPIWKKAIVTLKKDDKIELFDNK